MTSRPLVRLSILFLIPNAVFILALFFAESDDMVRLGNTLVISLAVGVCVAYWPAVVDVMTGGGGRKIDRGDLLALGIFCGWFSLAARSLWAIYWRHIDRPDYVDHPFVAYCVFLTACAAVFHMLAPGTIKSHVPTKRWITLGAWVTAGVFFALTAGWWLSLVTAEGYYTPRF